MGRRRCCCGNCILWEDGFDDRTEGNTLPDGINRIGPLRFTYGGALADWSIVSGRLIAGVADSQINFHSGAAKLWHVFARAYLPTTGDYVRMHYGGNYAMVERLASETRYTIAGESWEVSGTPSEPDLSTLFFPRSKHAYYFDGFPDGADSDIVATNAPGLSSLCFGGMGCFFTPCMDPWGSSSSAYRSQKQDLGSGFTTWGFSASAGAGVTGFELYGVAKKCIQLLVDCCTACWEPPPDTVSITASGFADRSVDCALSYWNRTFVLDKHVDYSGPCGWFKLSDPPDPPGATAIREITALRRMLDENGEQWTIEVYMPWISIGAAGIAGHNASEWTSGVLTREQICDGGTIPLVPGSALGVPYGYDIYADEVRPEGWITDCGPSDGTPPPHTPITLSIAI